jgi:hypothetical protein
MSPPVRRVVTGVAGPAVALGREGGRVLVGVARVVPVPGRAGLEQAAALTVSAVTGTVATALDVLVPSVVSAVLSRLDLTAVVTDQVDLDAVVRDVDVDAVAARLDIDAVIERMDLTALVRERVDLDAIVGEVDIDAVAARLDIDAVIERMDLTALVRERVDLDAIVGEVDIDAVAARLDIDAVIERMDLTALVRERVDLDAIVGEVDIDAVAARLDIDAVIDRVDLVGLAQGVMDALDLPAIIRGSTASVASESVQDVRLQTIAADEVVTRVVDRLLLRRRHQPPGPNGEAPAPSQPADPTETIPVQREVAAPSSQP